MDSLRKLILDDVADFYERTDPAHGIDHIEKTMDNAYVLCQIVGRKDLLKKVLIAVGYHDVWSQHRKTHHIDAFLEVCKRAIHLQQRYDLCYADVWEIANACKEHRASHCGTYHSSVSELVAAADRGIPKTEVADLFYRSYLYARGLGKSRYMAKLHCVEHIKEKFGDGGYGAVPDWYNTHFAEVLVQRKENINAFTVDDMDDTYLDELELKYKLASS